MEGYLPTPQYECDAEWRWPWWKFEVMPDLLFTTLHERFNTRVCPIQDPHSFVCDVRACAVESLDLDTFYTKLGEQRDRRVAELETAWREVCSRMCSMLGSEPVCGLAECKSLEMEDSNPQSSKNDKRYARSAALAHLSRTMSFNCMIDFFDGFVRDYRERERKREQELKRVWRRRELKYDNASVDPTQTPPADGDDASARDAIRPTTPPQSTRHPPSPDSSPESATRGQIDAIRLFPDHQDVGAETRLNSVPADEPEILSPSNHASPPLVPEAAEQPSEQPSEQLSKQAPEKAPEQVPELAKIPQHNPSSPRHLPPGGLSSSPQRKRKRDAAGNAANGGGAPTTAADTAVAQDPEVCQPTERRPAKRRATRWVTSAKAEGPPRRSARLAR